MKRLVKMVSRRSNVSKRQAMENLKKCKAEIENALNAGYFDEVSETFTAYTGLEADYLIDFLAAW